MDKLKDKKTKHTAEERAEELIRRFSYLTDEYYQTKCALEVAKEAVYIHNGPCSSNTGHLFYWEKVQTILKNKIKVIEINGKT